MLHCSYSRSNADRRMMVSCCDDVPMKNVKPSTPSSLIDEKNDGVPNASEKVFLKGEDRALS